jgi:acyl dehydratase
MIKGQEFQIDFLVSDSVYQGFLQTFKDHNPLHTQADFARVHGFKGEVMHGNILNGFLSYFIGEGLPTKEVIIHSQNIQFKLPVYLNDHLKFYSRIEEVYESVHAFLFKFYFENGEGKKVAKGEIQIGILT